jgi:hypothetical protein
MERKNHTRENKKQRHKEEQEIFKEEMVER